jgi:double-stranded uracil-DNA glycosylase
MVDLPEPAAPKASFAPETDPRTRVLVLGSLPGEISLRRGQYYANPQNHFWRLMQAVIGVELIALPYEGRLLALRAAGVGVWDVIQSAERRGSLDAAIRAHRPNALVGLAAGLPELRAVAFNGAKAFSIGRRALAGETRLELVALPSSSPAYTAPFERKLEQWLTLRRFLAA